MLQNIQTFSDLSAINTHAQLSVELCVQRHGIIDCDVMLNGQTVTGAEYNTRMDLLSPIILECHVRSFIEGSSGLEITKFSVNGMEILPLYQHLSSDGSCYLDRLGHWNISIPSSFYTWYHTITGQGWIA
jgi:hypothetical protein